MVAVGRYALVAIVERGILEVVVEDPRNTGLGDEFEAFVDVLPVAM
jgi:hypothetical protein